MKKYVKITTAAMMAFILAGCTAAVPADAPSDDNKEVTTEEAAASSEEPAAESVSEPSEPSDAEAGTGEYNDPKSLPEYKYSGSEEYLDVINSYLVKDEIDGRGTDLSDVYIPFSIIVGTDDSDPSDIIAYGSYNIDGYDLKNTTLVSVSGSRSDGAFHLKKDSDGSVSVVSADLALVEEDSLEIFAKVPDLYKKVIALTNGPADEAREEAIASYVSDNKLNITQWQDYGHEPHAVLNAPATPEDAQAYTYVSPFGYEITYDLRKYAQMSTSEEDTFDTIEEQWTGTFMIIKRFDGDDADEAISAALSYTDATAPASSDAKLVGSIPCKRAEINEPLEDGRIFRYICYAVPAKSGMITVLIETTYEKGVSEMSIEDLEKSFEGILSTFKLL